MKNLFFSVVFFVFSTSVHAQWKCVDNTGREYQVSQPVMTDKCEQLWEEPEEPEKPVKREKLSDKARQRTIEKAKEAVRSNLKDPYSAQFRKIIVWNSSTVCGEVNAKNTYGGYVGYTRFIRVAGSIVYFENDPDEKDFLMVWARNCMGLTKKEVQAIRGY